MNRTKSTIYLGKYCTYVLWSQPISPCSLAVTKMIPLNPTTTYSAMVFISEKKGKVE